MLSSSPRIQIQLSEALAVIDKHNFPRHWPGFLPELVSSLQKASLVGDYGSVNEILGTANSIFKNFRHQFRTDELFLDIKYCLGIFTLPLEDIFTKTDSLINDSAMSGSVTNIKPLFECQKLCCRIFFSLNFQDLPGFFEDHMNKWMEVFQKCLSSNFPALESTEDGLKLVDALFCKCFVWMLGKKLEESGVLTESLRLRSNTWGLHMPLVCPDGAVVAYAWKRQLAGQAGASAVDITRLSLKAFTDQKRCFPSH
ncbi:unnamed protein product [Eruca vesicaria subsp. sativa]|uniref:Exportin-2 central domain-containing protein n=1 Tax=Eruca vesicaria subsp. sativa TaxID=29727 RepID=A0ABC8IT33_ERUVS|nr:unnamed protein product [Eruca vesicaria subsp. sativa]